MNEWDARIREHRVWSEMQSLGPTIDIALTVLPSMLPQEFAGLERLKAVLAYGGKRLAAADPLITTPGPLDQIANALANTRNELDAFTTDKDPNHLISANIAADGALPCFYSLPGAYSSEELGALVSVVTGYRNMVEQATLSTKVKLEQIDATATSTLADLSTKADTRFAEFTDLSELLQTKLTDLATGLQSEHQKLTQIVSDQQGQFSTAQEARSKEFTEGLRLATQEINRLTTEYQSQFSTGQDARSKEFVDAQTLRQNGYAEIVKDYAKRLSDQDAEFTKHRTDFVQISKDELDRLTSEYAHLRDGVAMTRFLAWLAKEAPQGQLSEIDAALKLEEYRFETALLKQLSFPTIAGAGPHSALPHYRVSAASSRKITPGIFLVIPARNIRTARPISPAQ